VKLAGIVAVLAVIGLFAFQNCNKNPSADSLQNQNPSVSRFNLPVADISSVSFYVPDVTTVSKAGKTYSLKYNKTLKINFDTGEILELNDFNSDKATYCMPEDLLQELKSIIETSQVCKAPAQSSDQVCTQVYQSPYCDVAVGDDITALGSATDGCGNNSIDLCEDQDDVLKAFIQKLNSSYTTYSCNSN
jgi:hypothetical protein